MRVGLACPSNEGWGKSHTKGIYYPGGIVAVGSRVSDFMPTWDVTLLDGELLSMSDLEDRIRQSDFDVLGLSANTNNYQNCLRLAQSAKDSGVERVVLGGPHATAVPAQILRNRAFIDAVIVHDGEDAFLGYLRRLGANKKDFAGIQNLYWRDERREIKENRVVLPAQPPRFDDLDFTLIDLEPYWEQHAQEFPEISSHFVQGFTHVGCTWRTKTGGCRFCDIPYPDNGYVPPGRFWREVDSVKEHLDIESMKDYGDCITGNPERVKALLDARPAHLKDFEFSCYARSVEIDEKMADMLQALNVRYAYVGFDSGSNKMLASMRQGYLAKHNLDAAKRLAKRGINIMGSLIVGAEGESEETLKETEEFAEGLVSGKQRVTQLNCGVLNVTPGSPYGLQLKERFPALKEDDVWDIFETSKLWISTYCKAPYDQIVETAKRITSLNPSQRKRNLGYIEE